MAADDKSLDDMTVAELRERASALEITGRSSMNKSELRQAVAGAEGSAGDERPWRESPGDDDPENDAEGITAPSIGPNTTIEHRPPDERLDMDKISDVDAMGLDKRRQVQGKRYGASPAKQLAVYGGALAVTAALVFGGIIATNELDKAPPEGEVEPAPWVEVEQEPPPPIDFPPNIIK